MRRRRSRSGSSIARTAPLSTAAALAAIAATAIARRDGRFDEETTAYRLCNGEGDRVPGLVIDRYGEVAVLRLDTDAWAPHVDGMVAGLAGPLASRGVDRSASA